MEAESHSNGYRNSSGDQQGGSQGGDRQSYNPHRSLFNNPSGSNSQNVKKSFFSGDSSRDKDMSDNRSFFAKPESNNQANSQANTQGTSKFFNSEPEVNNRVSLGNGQLASNMENQGNQGNSTQNQTKNSRFLKIGDDNSNQGQSNQQGQGTNGNSVFDNKKSSFFHSGQTNTIELVPLNKTIPFGRDATVQPDSAQRLFYYNTDNQKSYIQDHNKQPPRKYNLI